MHVRSFLKRVGKTFLLVSILFSLLGKTAQPAAAQAPLMTGDLWVDAAPLVEIKSPWYDMSYYVIKYRYGAPFTWYSDNTLKGGHFYNETDNTMELATVKVEFSGTVDPIDKTLSFTQVSTRHSEVLISEDSTETMIVTLTGEGRFVSEDEVEGTVTVNFSCQTTGPRRCEDTTSLELSGSTTFSINFIPVTQPTPVIFLPGIAGSELYSGDNQLWPLAPIASRADLELKPDGATSVTGATITQGDILRSSPANFYGGLIDYFKGLNYLEDSTLFIIPYDWRLSIDQHFARIDQAIDSALRGDPDGQVFIVAHSMGGLVARAYVYSSSARARRVDSIITMGTPYYGAPKAYYALVDGYSFGNVTVDPKYLKLVAQNWPGAYQLFPRMPFVVDTTSHQVASLADTYALRYKGATFEPEMDQYIDTPENLLTINDKLMKKADQVHALSGSYQAPKPLPEDISLYVIIGVGVKTLGYYALSDWNGDGPYLDWPNHRKVVLKPGFTDGDGTVPLLNAQTSVATATYYIQHSGEASAAHADLPANAQVQTLLGNLLSENIPPGETYTPGSGLTDVEAGYISSVDFILHSDAHLRITDEDGRALGYSESGGVEESLAGSFLSINGVEYAAVANPERPLHVSVSGFQAGEFGLEVTFRQGGQAVSYEYPAVAVQPGTLAQGMFDPVGDPLAPAALEVSTGSETFQATAQNVEQETVEADPAVALWQGALESGLPEEPSTTTPSAVAPSIFPIAVVAIVGVGGCGLVGIALAGLGAFVVLRRRQRPTLRQRSSARPSSPPYPVQPPSRVPVAPSQAVRLGQAQLRIQDEAGRVTLVNLPAGRIVIGREPGNQVVLNDPQASRQHAYIELRNNVWYIGDLHSANGTFVNGSRIVEAPLKPGDVIQIGRRRLAFQMRQDYPARRS